MDYSHICDIDPAVASALDSEIERQRDTLAMIASENHVSEAALEAQGSALTNKYVESYPGERYYAGREYTDDVETLAVERARELWGVEHVNVQPRSDTQTNMGVYFAMLDPDDKILSLDLTHGGHLSHDHPASFTGKLCSAKQYEVDAEADHIDYDQPTEKAAAFEPDIIISGYSTYPRTVEWETIQEIADDVDAFHLADIAHITDLVTVGVHPSLVGIADFVTGSTHKTIHADRGGVIMCNEKCASNIDSTVFPGAQDGPLMHNITGRVVGFKEALQPEFEEYAQQVVDSTRTLTETSKDHGFSVVSGDTDTHLVLADLRDSHPDLIGGTAEETLESTGAILNTNTAPGETRPVFDPNGIRAGTPGLTTRDFGEGEARKVGELIVEVVGAPEDDDVLTEISEHMQELCDANPLCE